MNSPGRNADGGNSAEPKPPTEHALAARRRQRLDFAMGRIFRTRAGIAVDADEARCTILVEAWRAARPEFRFSRYVCA